MLHILEVLNKKLRKTSSLLWKQNGSPGERARGAAIGVLSGAYPFFGFQTLIGIALAKLLKGNLVLAVAGTWISNPFTYGPIYWFNFKVGCLLLGKINNTLSKEIFASNNFWAQSLEISLRLFIGSTVVGIIMALITFFVIYSKLTGMPARNHFRRFHK